MIRFVFRALGLWILAAAFLFLVYDGMRSIAATSLLFTYVKDFWSNIHQASLQAWQAIVESYSPWVWSLVVAGFLNQPIWLVFAVVGTIFIVLGRKKKKLIGYGRD